MGDKTLSVVVPNYNDGPTLGRSLDAIVGQSFPPKEVIVVDDGSTDGSAALVEAYARRHPVVRLVRHDKNRGMMAANRTGLSEATGDYVTFPAADDEVLPGLFEKSMRLLSRHPEAGLCSALTLLLDEKGEASGGYLAPVISDRECFVPPERVLETLERHGNWIMTHSAVFRRAALLELGGHDPALGPSADSVLFHALAARHGACFIPEPLARWRRDDESPEALRRGADFDASVRAFEAVESRLRSLALPEDHLRAWKRQALYAMLYETDRRNPGRFDQLALLCGRLPAPGLVDRAFRAGLRLGFGRSRALTKLYLFTRHPWRDQLRIVRQRFSR